jgi:predicted Zn finger-like uncharacterized protein
MTQATYYCPECGTAISLSRPLAKGKTIKCPECDQVFTAPSRGPETGGEYETYSSGERHSNLALWLWLSLGFGLLLLFVVCGGIGMVLWFAFREKSALVDARQNIGAKTSQARANARNAIAPTTFPPQTEDYAEARKKFKTKLLEQNPSPQPWDVVEAPAGVTELEYVSEELRLKAWVSSSPGAGTEKKPAVLFLHSGLAFGEDDWDEAKPFRDSGFVVMIPMLRGENGLPGSYSLFYDEVDDVLAAADALTKLPYVDSKRLYVAGHSEGGTLALLAAMTTERFRAAASFSGSPDPVPRVANQGVFGPAQVPFDSTDQKELQMRSPLAFPASFKCPVRLYYGEELQLKSSCRKLAEQAKEKKLDVAAVEVPGNHMTSVGPGMKQCIKFFQQH